MSESVINRKQLAVLYRKGFSVDADAEGLLMRLGDDFFTRVVRMACGAANARNATSLEIEDIKFVLEKHWNIRIPEYEKEDGCRPVKPSATKIKRDTQSRRHSSRKQG